MQCTGASGKLSLPLQRRHCYFIQYLGAPTTPIQDGHNPHNYSYSGPPIYLRTFGLVTQKPIRVVFAVPVSKPVWPWTLGGLPHPLKHRLVPLVWRFSDFLDRQTLGKFAVTNNSLSKRRVMCDVTIGQLHAPMTPNAKELRSGNYADRVLIPIHT